MESLKNMKKAMRATGLYTLTGETLVDKELEAYADALDWLVQQVEELRRESFLATAEQEGLAKKEALFELHAQGKTAEQRRAALITLNAVNANQFTPTAIRRIFQSFGLEMELVEDFAAQKIYGNNCSENPVTESMLADARKAARFLPAHLDVELDFRNLSWNTIDRNGRTFAEMDTADMAWEEIDNLGGRLLTF